MEFLTILLSSLLLIFSSSGLIVDSIIEKNLRQQVKNVEKLEVRIDNTPSYQLLEGKIDRVRISTHGLEITDYLTINTLELETDSLNLNLENIQKGIGENWRESLNEPLQGGLNLIITEDDLNKFLQSEVVLNWLNRLITDISKSRGGVSTPNYELLNPRIQFIDDNRLTFDVVLRRSADRQTQRDHEVARVRDRILNIKMETQLEVMRGHTIRLRETIVYINDKPLSEQLLNRISDSLNNFLDLRRLEEKGFTLRLLDLTTTNQKVNLTAFIRLNSN